MADITAPQILVKQPGETRQYSMDFSNLMASGETIEASTPAPSVTSELIGGGSSDLTISSVAISGQTVTFWIAGGTHAKRYRIEVTITTSSTQILEGDGILVVKDR